MEGLSVGRIGCLGGGKAGNWGVHQGAGNLLPDNYRTCGLPSHPVEGQAYRRGAGESHEGRGWHPVRQRLSCVHYVYGEGCIANSRKATKRIESRRGDLGREAAFLLPPREPYKPFTGEA